VTSNRLLGKFIVTQSPLSHRGHPLGIAIAFCIGLGMAGARADEQVQPGKYLFQAAGCLACHTDSKHQGAMLAGGRALATPFGTFYTPNITPDLTYGIGQWSEEDFVRALTEGVSPKGAHYYPVFPYTSYTRMSRADLHALWIYLRSVPPVAQPNKAHDTSWYLTRIGNWAWQRLFFKPGSWEPQAGESDAWNRGAYLANALAHCGECHTPRNALGAPKVEMAYAGTSEGPEGARVPNITSDPDTGIGRWTQDELLDFLKEGALPDGDYTGGLMAEVVDNGLKRLSAEDAAALATYIASLPPIHHEVAHHHEVAEKH